MNLPDALALRFYGSPSHREPFRAWLADGMARGLLSGADLNVPGTDAAWFADKLIGAAQAAGWLQDLGFAPSLSQAAFAGLEGRRTERGKVPAYSYPREHSWQVRPEAYPTVRAFCYPEEVQAMSEPSIAAFASEPVQLYPVRCTGCRAEDKPPFNKAGVEHWTRDGQGREVVCGQWEPVNSTPELGNAWQHIDAGPKDTAPESVTLHAIDLETHLIQPGLAAPPIVCGSHMPSRGLARLLSREEVRIVFEPLIKGETVVGANIAYDLAIIAAHLPALLPEVFRAYDEDRVYDVQIAQALDAIAGGHLAKDPRNGGSLFNPETGRKTDRYSLYTCVDLTLGRQDAKIRDFWRLRYAILDRLPIADWPADAVQYPKDDAANTLEVAEVQLGLRPSPITGKVEPFRNLHNMGDQARAAFALHLACVYGLRTNRAAVEALAAKVEDAHANAIKSFTGVFLRPDGTEDQSAVKKQVARAFGASGACPVCSGSGKVPSEKTGKPVICRVSLRPEDGAYIGCDGTGLDLASAPTLPRTDKGGIKTDRDTLEESGDDTLEAYAGVSEAEKLRGTYLPFLRQGLDTPLNTRANVLLETGRTSYDGPIQQIPRKGGVRECFVARHRRFFPEEAERLGASWVDMVYCSTDYSALELCTLAQVCLWLVGQSRMAETINASGDPGALHTAFAAAMVGVPVDEMKRLVKAKDKTAVDYRQAAKAANFGFPGGMGAAKLVLAKRKRAEGETTGPDGTVYAGIRFCLLLGRATRCGVVKVTEWKKRTIPPTCKECILCAEDLKKQWLEQWPEMVRYFEIIAWQADNEGAVKQFVSDRVRGGIDFSSAANGYFQGLAADGAKRALWLVTRECYTDTNSPLYGTRPVIFVHDEIFSEMPEARAHLAGPRQAELMIAGMKEYVPDVTISVEPALMRRWSKDAATVYDANGRLAVWEPGTLVYDAAGKPIVWK